MVRGWGGDRYGRVRPAHLQKCNLALRVLQRRFGRSRASARAASTFAPAFAPVPAAAVPDAAAAAARLLARAGTHRARRGREELGECAQRERDVAAVGAEYLAVAHAGGAELRRGAQAGRCVGSLGETQQRLHGSRVLVR